MKKEKEIIDVLQKADSSIKAAELLLKEGYHDFSASRSYYAMFYIAEAILLTRNLSFSSHKAVISAFGKEFIKSGELPAELHRYLREAFKLRQAGDYGHSLSLGSNEAKNLIKQAKEFKRNAERYLRKEGYKL